MTPADATALDPVQTVRASQADRDAAYDNNAAVKNSGP